MPMIETTADLVLRPLDPDNFKSNASAVLQDTSNAGSSRKLSLGRTLTSLPHQYHALSGFQGKSVTASGQAAKG